MPRPVSPVIPMGRAKILLVGDSREELAELALHLEGLGVEVKATPAGGVTAGPSRGPNIQNIQNIPDTPDGPDTRDAALAILASHRPEINGTALIERLRSVAGNGDLPVIVLRKDHNNLSGLPVQDIEQGRLDILAGPLTPLLLRGRVRAFLELHRARQAAAWRGPGGDGTSGTWEDTFNAITDIITIQDTDMRIVRANLAAGLLFGLAPEALIGRRCYELFRDTTEPCAGCPGTRTFLDHTRHVAEITHHKLGKTLLVSASPLYDGGGRFVGLVHTAKDISEQKKMEQQFRQAQKMEAMGTLAGGIAHDFNNILAAIIGFGDLAVADLPPGSRAGEDLNEVLAAADRAKTLVKQILSFSRQVERDQQPILIHLIVKEALKLLRASIPTTIEIRSEIDTDCGPVMADPTQIHQVLMNLCTNAYHAMADGGILAVGLKKGQNIPVDPLGRLGLPSSACVVLEVSDTGCGMDQNTVERIFDPYFTTKAEGKGTGLGLAMVHGIVVSHHGRITVDSEPGRGSTFRVYLPRLATGVTRTAMEKNEPCPTGDERILVVDDEKPVVRVTSLSLQNLGYRVVSFSSSEEAVAEFRSRPDDFDLIITDMAMPRMSGAQLTREVLLIRPDMPIILCTGYSESINDERARELGIRKFLLKPVVRKTLATAVRAVLDEGKKV